MPIFWRELTLLAGLSLPIIGVTSRVFIVAVLTTAALSRRHVTAIRRLLRRESIQPYKEFPPVIGTYGLIGHLRDMRLPNSHSFRFHVATSELLFGQVAN